MVNEILNSLSSALYDKFGPEVEIYTDVVEMGSADDCFFLQVLEPTLTRYPNRRWRMEVPLDVHYFQGDGTDTTALYDIGTRALHIFVTYPLFLRDVEETELMETLTQEVGIIG